MKMITEISIYKITNLINKKVYIGKTRTFYTRIQSHINNNESEIGKAIKEFGHNNFQAEIIERTNSEIEAKKLEKYYINHYNSLLPNGYNIEDGKQKSNITIKKNILNRDINNFSGYAGVYYDKKNNVFIMRLKNREQFKSKSFKNIKETAEFYDMCIMYLYGEDCIVNFPEYKEKYLKSDIYKNLNIFFNKKNSSKFIGVCWKSNCNKWASYYNTYENKKLIQHTIGFFKNEKVAAFIRDIYIIVNNIKNDLNFPDIMNKVSKRKIAYYYNYNELKNSPLEKGVFFKKQDNKWVANLLLKKAKKIYVGRFATKEQAKEALKNYAEKNNLYKLIPITINDFTIVN